MNKYRIIKHEKIITYASGKIIRMHTYIPQFKRFGLWWSFRKGLHKRKFSDIYYAKDFLSRFDNIDSVVKIKTIDSVVI